MPRILLIADDSDRLAAGLREVDHWEVAVATTVRHAWEQLVIGSVDLLIIDAELRDGDALRLAAQRPSGTRLLVFGEDSQVDSVVRALRFGALDYLVKPVGPVALARATALALAEKSSDSTSMMPDAESGCVVLRGGSAAMQRVYKLITKVAPEDVVVCLSGETGTGKELVASVIHQLSPRRDAPSVVVNCGAIPPDLVESLLFGHERGSFTGADRMHRGVFEQAAEGTLFLDEITSMPRELQVKLLRVLESGSVTRIGGETAVAVRARIVCATNDPEGAIRAGMLREDLWYRLNVFRIDLPPLRERYGDIPVLAAHFLDEFRGDREMSWHPDALIALERHWWPGNVRELKNTVYRSLLLARSAQIESPEFLGKPGPRPAEGRTPRPPGTFEVPLGSSVADLERALILATLADCDGNKQRTAVRLGVSLKRLYMRLNSYARGDMH